jgi:hypothetical protein
MAFALTKFTNAEIFKNDEGRYTDIESKQDLCSFALILKNTLSLFKDSKKKLC